MSDRITMDNKLKEMKNYELKFARDSVPYRVFATWNIHYACNYKCSYCHAPKPQQNDAKKAAYISSDEWINIWHKNYDKYGTWEILISGGEPFAYPEFMDLVIKLSKIHIVGVCTNLHWDVEHFVKYADPRRIRIETSFHPEFSDLDEFVKKLGVLKKSGFAPTVNFVPWPPLLNKMRLVKEKVEAAGCQLTLQPFIGEFEKRNYPQGYTGGEREFFKIFDDECNLKTLDFKTTKESDSTRGKLCRMGQNYVFIHPDGDVSRCCRDHSFSLGNVIDGTFKLLDQPLACNAQNCNCWRCMLAGKEDFWWKEWGRTEITALTMEKYGKRNNPAAYRVSLIQPPVWGISEPPVALAQISSCLKKAAYEVSVFDLNIEFYNRRKAEYNTVWAIEQSAFWANRDNVKKFFEAHSGIVEEYIGKIIEAKPDLAGFSVNVCSLPATLELAERLKAKIPGLKIVIGGQMFFKARDVSFVLENDSIDVIVRDEGEETFCDLAGFFLEGKDLALCQGIYFKKDGKIIKTTDRKPVENLDSLPFLDFVSFPGDKYDSPGHLGRHVSLIASRGCVFNCVYCGPKSYWPGFRYMSGRRIYEEVKYHIENAPAIEHIEFLDLELNGNIKALEDFCDLMVAHPPKEGVSWHANIIIRPEMDYRLLSKMKQAGCRHLSIGIETGSQRVLGLMRKKYKIEDAENVFRDAHRAGIHLTTNFMFGFPGETEEDFNLTLEFLRRNSSVIGTVYPSRSFFTIEPFSYLAEHMEEFGVVENPVNNLYWESSDGKNNYPERLRRCEEFCRLASELGVAVGLGLQTSLELDRFYSLGYYYYSKKDFSQAGHFFKEYIKLDPKNLEINEKLRQLEAMGVCSSEKSEEGPSEAIIRSGRQVSFNWDITSVCNYRCPYCWFYGKWAEIKRRNLNLPVAQLERFWSEMYNEYGSIKISITGGEPFLYPGFIDLIASISSQHQVEVVSNLSWPVKRFVDKIQGIKIHPSFHPLFTDLEEFMEKIILLRKKKLAENPSYVAWPPQIPALKYYADKFKEYKIEMFVQPFFGEYKGARYPDAYTNQELEAITPYLGRRGGEKFHPVTEKTKGKLCYAGVFYGIIHPDGDILRCGGIHSEDAKIGNIGNTDFRLLEEAYPCSSQICPCNEWVFLLKEK